MHRENNTPRSTRYIRGSFTRHPRALYFSFTVQTRKSLSGLFRDPSTLKAPPSQSTPVGTKREKDSRQTTANLQAIEKLLKTGIKISDGGGLYLLIPPQCLLFFFFFILFFFVSLSSPYSSPKLFQTGAVYFIQGCIRSLVEPVSSHFSIPAAVFFFPPGVEG